MTDTSTARYALGAGVLFLRVVQLALVAGAVVFFAGGLAQNVLAALFLSVFALVLLAFAGVLQVIVWGAKKRWGSDDE